MQRLKSILGRKTQTAREFLLYYGWALVFLIIISSIVFYPSLTHSSSNFSNSSGISTFGKPVPKTDSCTVTLYLNGQTTNSSAVVAYGASTNYTAEFTATTSGSSGSAPAITYNLYINGKNVGSFTTSTNPSGTTTLNNITGVVKPAGTVIVTANSTGATTNCQETLKQTINKVTLSQTLKAYPSSSFTYSGSTPTMQDTLNGTLLSGNTFSFVLDNGSTNVVTTSSSSSAFNFSVLPGKYASAGPYSYSSAAVSNTNYTILVSPSLAVTISKATPVLTITDSPGNFTYNGTKDNTSGLVTTINNQLTANLYINGVKSGATATRISYLNATTGTYKGVFNTSGNQNYTSDSVKTESIITKATPTLTLISSPSVNYTQNGTYLKFHFSISSVNNQLPGSFYVNNSLKNSSITTSGVYNTTDNTPNTFIAKFNTSGNQNYTSLSTSISRQIYAIVLELYLNGVRDSNTTITYGTQSNFTASISDSADYVSLYVNGTKVVGLTKGTATYLKTLATGLYKVIASTNISGLSNQTFYEKINKATPTLTLTASLVNFTYNGKKEAFTGTVTSINNQLTAKLYVNDTTKDYLAIQSTATSTSYDNATANAYWAVFNTTGNQNYTAISTKIARNISKATPAFTITDTPGNFTYNGTKDNTTGQVFPVLENNVIKNITVGSKPEAVAITPNGQEAYVTNYGQNTVYVLNTSSFALIKNITVGSGPDSVAITPNGQEAYVADYKSGNVSVINTSSLTTIKNISMGTHAVIIAGHSHNFVNSPAVVAITPNGQEAYVSLAAISNVSVINTSSLTTIKNITVGSGPEGVAITPNGQEAYVANNGANTTYVLNTSSFALIKNITGFESPIRVAITPNGQEAYVTNYDSNTVSVINTSSNAVIDTITVGSSPEGIVITPNGKETYVTNYGSNTVSVINVFSYPITVNLYINGKKIGATTSTNNIVTYLNATAGTFKGVFNTSWPFGVMATPSGPELHIIFSINGIHNLQSHTDAYAYVFPISQLHAERHRIEI